MIVKIDAYMIQCDVCGEDFMDYHDFSVFMHPDAANPEDCDWYVNEDQHICPGCHHITDDDELVIHEEKRKS